MEPGRVPGGCRSLRWSPLTSAFPLGSVITHRLPSMSSFNVSFSSQTHAGDGQAWASLTVWFRMQRTFCSSSRSRGTSCSRLRVQGPRWLRVCD